MKPLLLILVLLISSSVLAQEQLKRSSDLIDATVGVGSYRGSLSFSYNRVCSFGKNKRLGLGAGARLTSFLGANLYYITAPAELTTESTSPLILFRENVEANLDSLLIQSPQVNSVNLFINIEYRLSEKITAGFSIDAIGFSFGANQRANFMSGATGKNTSASPTPWNILLISDNDRGSLNSDLYLKYFLNQKWAIKAGTQFLFTEYTTDEKVQEYPKENDRFRNKSLLASVGVSLKL